MKTHLTIRNKILENCKELCSLMNQDESLHDQKFKRMVKDVTEKIESSGRSAAFINPIDFYLLVYNESVSRLNQRKGNI